MTELDARWCCMTCNTTFPVGKMFFSKTLPNTLECPHCRSINTHPASGGVVELVQYLGPVGTLN